MTTCVRRVKNITRYTERLADQEDYVIIDRLFINATDDFLAFMIYKLHRIDTPNGTCDRDHRSKDISQPHYNIFWDRQRHNANSLQHSLPERHMLKIFTEITNNTPVDLVDGFRTVTEGKNCSMVTVRLYIAPEQLVDIIHQLINDKPNAAQIIKLADSYLGVNFKKDAVKCDDSDEDVSSREASLQRSERSSSNLTTVDEDMVETKPQMNAMYYGRIEQPVNRHERNLFRLAAVALDCGKADMSRIQRAKLVGVFEKLDPDDKTIDILTRVNATKFAPELTIVCDHNSYVDEFEYWMSGWMTEMFNACMENGVVAVEIVNDTGDLVPPPNAIHPITKRGRRYIEAVEVADNIVITDVKTRLGCNCPADGDCLTDCSCSTGGVPYECKSTCWCSHERCKNRVVTKCARRVRLQLRRTEDIGWAVYTLENIVKGQTIGYYVCEMKHNLNDQSENDINVIENKRVGPLGHTQLFDLPGNHYVLDSYDAGNVMTFIQHSCDPNCKVKAVWTQRRDPKCPFLTFYAHRDIPAGTPLSFNYMDTMKPTSTIDVTTHNDEERYPMEKCRCGAKKCYGVFQKKNTKLFSEFENLKRE